MKLKSIYKYLIWQQGKSYLIYFGIIFVIVHPSFYRFHLYNDSSSVYPKRKRIFFSKDKGTCVVIGVTYGKKRNKIKAGNLLAFF